MATLFRYVISKTPTTKKLLRKLSANTSNAESKLDRRWIVTLDQNKGDLNDFVIKLNNIAIKTPMKNEFRIKDETLASEIFEEWRNVQNEKKLDLKRMHLTTLAYEAIDNPFKETKQAIVEDVIEYLRFDTVRFRDPDNEGLLERQSRHWDPIVGWFEINQDCSLPIDYGNVAEVESIPKDTEEKICKRLNSIDWWPLVATRFMTRNLKSFVLATTLTERFLKVEQAVDLARLENKFQIEKWSKVEWEHDVDEQIMRSRVASGSLFYHLSK